MNKVFAQFFSFIQEKPWYRDFLNPVIYEIDRNGKLLDIGTGTGKLLQILAKEKEIDCVGVDTNADMLFEAQKKLKDTTITLLNVKANTSLPFTENSFDYITMCNVLFHLNNEGIDFILGDTLRLLKDDGKIVVLTPTGDGNVLKLTKHFFSLKNLSVYLWFYATKNRAGPWTKNTYLKQYSATHGLRYTRKIVMNGFAQMEVLER